jgi:class 3 adenylate cyclase
VVSRPEARYATDAESTIAYQVVGDGPLDLLFVGGGQYPIDLIWDDPIASRFLTRLTSFSRLVMLDQYGWGASHLEVSGRLPTLEGWADNLRLVLDAAGIERCALFGFGPGAYFSIFFAAAHPDRVTSLVLMGAFARFLRDLDYPAGMPGELLEAVSDSVLESHGTGDDLELFAPSRAGEAEFRAWWARCERLASSPANARAYWANLAQGDVRSALPAIQVPTLVLHRKGDQFVRVDHARYLAANIADSRLVELPGDDHFYFAGDSDTILDEVEVFLTGARAAHDLDRVLSSVCFTDIVESTRLAAELGDRRWRATLDSYEVVVRRELDRHRGRHIKSTGDGTLATFDGPARAIRCALSVRDAARTLGLDLRAGLHTGEIELRGEDIGGIAVHVAARIAGKAGPGEVFTSSTLPLLVAGSTIGFTDRGEHELRGLPGTWKLFSVDDAAGGSQ